MREMVGRIPIKKYMIWGVKAAVFLFLLVAVAQSLIIRGTKPYETIRHYSSRLEFTEALNLSGHRLVTQKFEAQGNHLMSVDVYFGELKGQQMTIGLTDGKGKELKTVEVNLNDYTANAWNTVAVDDTDLCRGQEYGITFRAEEGLDSVCVAANVTAPAVYGSCYVSDGLVNGTLAVGFKFVDQSWSAGGIIKCILQLFLSVLLLTALGYSILKFETLYDAFRTSEKKHGLGYAVFGSVLFALLHCPLDSMRNEVTDFKRMIGIALLDNIDASKRNSNFFHWFLLFAVALALFFCLANYLCQKERGTEGDKMATFLDHFIVLANVAVGIKCFTWFHDCENKVDFFDYSLFLLILLLLMAAGYLLFHLENNITVNVYAKLLMMAVSFAYVIAVLWRQSWEDGMLLLGVQVILLVCCLFMARFHGRWLGSDKCSVRLGVLAVLFSLLPFLTSFCIELFHILNQHNVFVSKRDSFYAVVVAVLLGISVAVCVIAQKKGWNTDKWKKWSYPFLVFGVSCLSAQIPLVQVCQADLMESANSSVLISDFIKFGTIPLVEHYGGHMMTNVWEGLLYGWINNDYAGAIFCPYAPYILTISALCFFYLVKYVWNEDMALFAALFFPFYSVWHYYGLGMLVCLAIIAYMRKNTYVRAIWVWFAIIWCVVYRLDLGFAFGIAAVIALTAYIAVDKNKRAAKQLIGTLAGWGAVCLSVWCVLCAVNGISPIQRLREFLAISSSNINWAYVGIGDTASGAFTWVYMICPLALIACLMYTLYAKTMREHTDRNRWMLLLLLGFAYLANFSRGLVRHTLMEGAVRVTAMWTCYVFLALFISCWRRNKKVFLPTFAILILGHTMIVGATNFTEQSIVEQAAQKTGTFVDAWYTKGNVQDMVSDRNDLSQGQTDWQMYGLSTERAVRTVWDDALTEAIKPYRVVMDLLLDEDETFVDFVNASFVYSALERKNPVYVSQSPLQLSGEFAQEMFLEEMKDIPLVVMPGDSVNSHCSSELDGIANAYRYYRVSEYIYQHYVPLCTYGSVFAVWCLPERYQEMTDKLADGVDYTEQFILGNEVAVNDCVLSKDGNQVRALSGSTDPFLAELQTCIDTSDYVGLPITICVGYETDVSGQMQMYYTTDAGENYTEAKSVSVWAAAGAGIAEFTVPVTEFTRLRLDLPADGVVRIDRIAASMRDSLITWGYDGPTAKEDGTYAYSGVLHHYTLRQLPRIWAETDQEEACENVVVAELTAQGNLFVFDKESVVPGKNGNYLMIHAVYDGMDQGDLYRSDDEMTDVLVKAGNYENGTFTEKYRYRMTVNEGEHDYLIRVSADYYWYLREVNAVVIEADGFLHDVKMHILEGD